MIIVIHLMIKMEVLCFKLEVGREGERKIMRERETWRKEGGRDGRREREKRRKISIVFPDLEI